MADVSSHPTVELLWWRGCPSWKRALAELRDAMKESGRDPAAVVVTEIETESHAEEMRFVGSPTIRIDGTDLQPPGEEPVGLTCRIYRLRDGRVSPLPDPADLHDALAATKHERTDMTPDEAARTPGVGDPAPGFDLPDTDGKHHTLDGLDGPAVVVFTCNHCPYALAWHDRLAASARDYAGRGVRFYAINSNDSERYPRDSYEAMRQRVAEEDWPLPYLHDATQEVARAFGAKTTPDVFVMGPEGRIRYRGAPDPDYSDPTQNAIWLRSALDAVLAGNAPEPAETDPVGCSVKWKG